MDFSFTFKKKPEGAGAKQPPKESASAVQAQQLRGCGINLAGHATVESLGVDDAACEASPFVALLCAFGAVAEDGSAVSDDVYMLDPAWFEAEGGLGFVAMQLSRICKGAMPIEEPASTLSEDGIVAMSFVLDGEAAGWEVNLRDEESGGAMQILTGLATIAQERGDGAALAWTPVEGAGYLCVFMNDSDLNDLGQTTGLEWSRLV